MTEKIAGSIHAGRKPRRKLTLADRISELDKKIERARDVAGRLETQRNAMIADARAMAESALAEAEAVTLTVVKL